MIRLTKQTDYGIVLLTHMAGLPDRQFNATELAAESRLPQPTVSKILKVLARADLLDSHRGVKGGYTLARDPETITVTEIIGALEGGIGITECIDDTPGECSHEARCPVRGNWHRINEAIRQALDGINLAEMAQPEGPPLVSLGSAPMTRSAEVG
jgi:FeS assembly SUF system regulator